MIANGVELKAAMTAAKGGEVLFLAPGPHTFQRGSYRYPSEVVIASADPSNPAILRGGVTLDDPMNLAFDSVEFDIPAATNTSATAVRLYKGTNIFFRNCGLTGVVGKTAEGLDERRGNGIMAQDTVNLGVSHCQFSTLKNALALGRITGAQIYRNDATDLGSDFFTCSESRNIDVIENLGTNWSANPGAHCDFGQLACNGTVVCENIRFIRNAAYAGRTGDAAQFLFGRAEINQKQVAGSPPVRHKGIQAIDNLGMGFHFHGVSWSDMEDALIEANRLRFVKRSTSTVTKTWIALNTNTLRGVVRNNEYAGALNLAADVVNEGNRDVGVASTFEQCEALLADWMAKYRPQPENPILTRLAAAEAEIADIRRLVTG